MIGKLRFNDGIAAALVFVLAVSPTPLGSNRPMFWAISAAFVFLIMTMFIIQQAKSGRELSVPFSKLLFLTVPLGMLLVFSAVQTLGVLDGISSVTPRASLLAVVRMASYASFFFLVLQVSANPRRLRWMLVATFIITAIYAGIGFAHAFSALEFPPVYGLAEYEGSATGTFINRNSFATYLGFGALVGTALMSMRIVQFRSQGFGALDYLDIRLAVYLTLVVLLLVTLVATNSRMGVSALLVAATLFVSAALLKQAQTDRRRKLAAAAIVSLLITGAFYLYGATLLERLGSVENDADVRLALYKQVWSMISTRPFTGFGADSFELAFQGHHRSPVSPDLVWDKAHNTYLTNWAELGLIFGSIPIVLGGFIFIKLSRTVLSAQTDYIISLLGAAVILQAAVHSLADFSLEIQANMYLFLAILGMSMADVLDRRQPRKE